MERELEDRDAAEISSKYAISRLEQEKAGLQEHNRWIESQVFKIYLFILFFGWGRGGVWGRFVLFVSFT